MYAHVKNITAVQTLCIPRHFQPNDKIITDFQFYVARAEEMDKILNGEDFQISLEHAHKSLRYLHQVTSDTYLVCLCFIWIHTLDSHSFLYIIELRNSA